MKIQRHAAILRVVRDRRIESQDELREALSDDGFVVTQATLSRDIRELGLVKTPEGYRQMEATSGPGVATMAAEFLWSAVPAQNLVVLKTAPGHANSLAVSLDQEDWPEVVGTIAGDDTILVVTPDSGTAVAVQRKLLGYLES